MGCVFPLFRLIHLTSAISWIVKELGRTVSPLSASLVL
jgi:hypothetical protein